MARRRRRRKAAASVWFAVAATCGAVAAITQSLLWFVVCLATLTVGVVAVFAGRDAPQLPAVPAVAVTASRSRSTGKSRSAAPRRRGQPAQPPSAMVMQPSGRGKPKCSAGSCQYSTKDVGTCTCGCRGANHGLRASAVVRPQRPTRTTARRRTQSRRRSGSGRRR